MIAIFVETVWFRVPGALIAFGWSTYASVGFLSESKAHLSNRRALAVSIKCQNSRRILTLCLIGLPSLSLLSYHCMVGCCIIRISLALLNILCFIKLYQNYYILPKGTFKTFC